MLTPFFFLDSQNKRVGLHIILFSATVWCVANSYPCWFFGLSNTVFETYLSVCKKWKKRNRCRSWWYVLLLLLLLIENAGCVWFFRPIHSDGVEVIQHNLNWAGQPTRPVLLMFVHIDKTQILASLLIKLLNRVKFEFLGNVFRNSNPPYSGINHPDLWSMGLSKTNTHKPVAHYVY